MPSEWYGKAGEGFGKGAIASLDDYMKNLAEKRKRQEERQTDLEKASITAGTSTYDPTTGTVRPFQAPSVEELSGRYPDTQFYVSGMKGTQPTLSGYPKGLMPKATADTSRTMPEINAQPHVTAPLDTSDKQPIENTPFGVTAVDVQRRLGRFMRVRPEARAMTEELTARSAQLTQDLGDTGNKALQERLMSMKIAPSDDQSYIERKTMRFRVNQAMDAEEEIVRQQLQSLQGQQYRLGSISGKTGARITADPAIDATRRVLMTKLQGIQQARVKMNSWYDEADRTIPAIGTPEVQGPLQSQPSHGLTPQQKESYNQMREQGMSPEEAKRRIGL